VVFFNKKHKCEEDGEKFNTYNELIEHARKIHHYTILKCSKCGKQFYHEKDRLHHVREEHGKEMDARVHKNEHKHKKEVGSQKRTSPQEEVNSRTKNFGDNF
jgi:uncharacterized C2H2 Zn-finger protein